MWGTRSQESCFLLCCLSLWNNYDSSYGLYPCTIDASYLLTLCEQIFGTSSILQGIALIAAVMKV